MEEEKKKYEEATEKMAASGVGRVQLLKKELEKQRMRFSRKSM